MLFRSCNGDCNGSALLDSCGVCSGGNSGHIADSDQDCNLNCNIISLQYSNSIFSDVKTSPQLIKVGD